MKKMEKAWHGIARNARKRRRLEDSTTASSSTPGISGSGEPSTGVSAPARPSPGEVGPAVEVPPELDLPGPSVVSSETPLAGTGGGATIEIIEDMPTSASLKKLGDLGEKGNLAGKPLEGNRVLNISTVASELSRDVVCRYCGSDMVLSERFGNRNGMVSRISFDCTNENCKHSTLLSDPRSTEAKILNKQSVLSARNSCLGRRGLEVLTACLDLLPPVTAKPYSEHNKNVREAVIAVTEDIMQEAGKELHDFFGKPHDQVIDVGVT